MPHAADKDAKPPAPGDQAARTAAADADAKPAAGAAQPQAPSDAAAAEEDVPMEQQPEGPQQPEGAASKPSAKPPVKLRPKLVLHAQERTEHEKQVS